MGFTALQQGRHDAASGLLDESLRTSQANGELIPILVDGGRITDARHRWMTAYQQAGPADSAVVNLALLGYAAAIAAADGRPRRAVVLTEIALGLLSATGWRDDELLAWFWRTVTPAYQRSTRRHSPKPGNRPSRCQRTRPCRTQQVMMTEGVPATLRTWDLISGPRLVPTPPTSG
jgi:hypothetical protein